VQPGACEACDLEFSPCAKTLALQAAPYEGKKDSIRSAPEKSIKIAAVAEFGRKIASESRVAVVAWGKVLGHKFIGNPVHS
jgi:hypothetical protein